MIDFDLKKQLYFQETRDSTADIDRCLDLIMLIRAFVNIVQVKVINTQVEG